jgi:formiminoglutamase
MNTLIKCCIIGIPDHQAVNYVGGRIGAARGPTAFRKIFSKFRGNLPVQERIIDGGDVLGLGADVALNHRKAADLVKKLHSQTGFSIIVGGSHDHGYSHLLGVRESTTKKNFRLGCLNIDAHLDVRKPSPYITSGSPFYLALESKVIDPSRFIEFGIQSHCNGRELWDYTKNKKIEVVNFAQLRRGKAVQCFQQKLRKLQAKCDAVVISFDLDAATAADAPGVSAPQAEGFTSMELIEMMEIAGSQKKVVSLGIFELNPEHDLDDRTARLAATAAYHFIESKMKS